MKNKKQFIIDQYIKDKDTDFEQFEFDNSYVWRVLEDYKRLISTTYEIGCALSEDLLNIHYLFANGEEKTLKVEDGVIINCEVLNEYEIRWLDINRGWKI